MPEFFNKNLKYLRTIKNISQQSLADMVGVDRSTVSLWENDKIEITLDKAILCAKVLKVPYPDMFGTDLSKDAQELSASEFANEVSELINKSTMDDKQRKMIESMLECIKED